MATIAGTSLGGPVEFHGALTVADVAALPCDLPSGSVTYELDNGKLKIMMSPGSDHGYTAGEIIAALKYKGQYPGHGMAYSEVGIVLWRSPDRLVGADAAFVSIARLPAIKTPEGYLQTIPDLVVEVRSKNDTWPEIERKVSDYHTGGVAVVWVLDQATRAVMEYRPDKPRRVWDRAETLTIDELIPGFDLSVDSLFVDE